MLMMGISSAIIGQLEAGRLHKTEALVLDRLDRLDLCDGLFVAAGGDDDGLALLRLLDERGEVRLRLENGREIVEDLAMANVCFLKFLRILGNPHLRIEMWGTRIRGAGCSGVALKR